MMFGYAGVVKGNRGVTEKSMEAEGGSEDEMYTNWR